MFSLNPIPTKLHRKIEKSLSIEKNCLKDQVKQLQEMGQTQQEILAAAKGALEWMKIYHPTMAFPIVFQMYVSSVKLTTNPALN